MRTNKTAAKLLACALALGALAGCTMNDRGRGQGVSETAEARTSAHSFAFGAGEVRAQSLVNRRVAASGAESLESRADLWLGGAHPLVLVEKAQIDASGRLQAATAELLAGPAASELVRSVQLDAKAGNVTVRDSRGERSFAVPVDHPWTYAGLFADVSPAASSTTAVMAWVARRAAQAGSKIREVEAAGQSHLTVPAQIVFRDGPMDLIVLGDEVAEADHEFVRALPWKALAAEGAGRRTPASPGSPATTTSADAQRGRIPCACTGLRSSAQPATVALHFARTRGTMSATSARA